MSANVFVVIPNKENHHGIVIGKNSNRKPGEVHELVLDKENINEDAKSIHSTLNPGPKTFAVILSKAVGIWGCEIGANEKDLVGLTVSFKDDPTDGIPPQDFLRLTLERSGTADSAVDLLGSFLTENETPSGYVLADKEQVWYVEAVSKAWVAEKLTPGVKILPPAVHIGSNYDKHSGNLEDLARGKGWDGDGKVPWNEIFLTSNDGDKQVAHEKTITSKHFQNLSDFSVQDMIKVLRDVENRISRGQSDNYPTASSQVSVLPQKGPSCHWFTVTPDPTLSVFKPFIFTPNARISTLTDSSSSGDGKHQLYRLHAAATSSGENKVISLLQEMEANCLNEVNTFMFDAPEQNLSEVDDLLKDCVEAEVKFYK